MDNQKLFLLIGIFLSIFLLWNQWQITHTTDANGNLISKTQLTSAAPIALDVPSLPANQAKIDLPDIDKNQNNTAAFTTVITDLLTVEISHKGATVQNAFLNTYAETLNSEQKFQLLSAKSPGLLQAQSGLLPDTKMPTHHAMFVADNDNYQLNGDTLTVPFKWRSNGIEVVKNFHFHKNSYMIKVDYQISNNTNSALTVSSYTQLVRNRLDQSSLLMPTFSGGARYNDEEIYEKINFEDFDSAEKTTSKGGWIAMLQHYFMAVWIADKNLRHTYSSAKHNDNYLLTTVNQGTIIPAKTTKTLSSNTLYIGPKEQIRIDNAAPGLNKTVDYGILFIIAKPLSVLLHWIYSWVQSWGWSIIILTILIKIAFFKLSEKSYRSMAGMRKLAPRLAKIKESFGDDKQKYGQKTMELYKKEKINPASGCLPILVQMPVFISLYWILIETVELRQQPFWYLADLSAQDPYYILPIIMGLSMFIQQKLNPPPPDPMQAKIMASLPVVFTIFFLWFASGLVLYWVVNNILSIAQQWLINKRING